MRLNSLVASFFLATVAVAAPSIPGIGIHYYGAFNSGYRAYTLSFDPAGNLYAGSDNNATDGEFMRRIPAGGGFWETISNEKIYDPDGVLFDVTGAFSGEPGTLLVASSDLVPFSGRIRALRGNGTNFNAVGPLAALDNNDAMAFDSAKNLYINVAGNRTIAKFKGISPQVVITLPVGGGVLAIDDSDRIWVACADGRIRRYGSDHVLQATITVSGNDPALGYCAGGTFPKGIYTVNRSTGALYRVTPSDTLVQVGTGFPNTHALAFDAAGNLYCANYDTGEVLRSGCVADLNADGFVDDADFTIFIVAYNMLDCADPAMPALCPADLNRDGLVEDSDFVIFVAAYNELICP